MRRRYTDEALSRVLSEHAAGTLERGGMAEFGLWTDSEWPSCCVNQAAFNEPMCSLAYDECPAVAQWFDNNYRGDMSPEELLHAIEERA